MKKTTKSRDANATNAIVPMVSVLRAKEGYVNISPVARYIATTSGLVDADQPTVLVTLPAKEASVMVSLHMDPGIKLSKTITSFDAATMDAVYSLYIHGCQYFTAETVARMLSGSLDGTISAQKIGAVTKSIHKLRHIDIMLDLTDEVGKTGRKIDGMNLIMTSYLLPVEEYSAVRSPNGKIIHDRQYDYGKEGVYGGAGFSFIQRPVLYTYAESRGEIEHFSTSLLSAPDVTDTDENMAIKWYLIRRVAVFRRARNKAHVKDIIYYDRDDQQGALTDLGILKAEYRNWRDKRKKFHSTVVAIMEAFVKESYITSYEVIYENCMPIGVELTIDSEY